MLAIERETSITYNAGEDHALVCTFQPRDQKRLEKFGFKPYRKSDEGRWYSIPKEYIVIRKKKQVSEASRARLSKNCPFRKTKDS